MRTLDVCLTPRLIADFDLHDKTVVVVDVLRATSCMVTALAHGVHRIIPVHDLEEARRHKQAGIITAAERDGHTAEGFDMGNSPFGFMEPHLQGQTLAHTTTNGTKSIVLSAHAAEVVVGAFLNLQAVASYCAQAGRDVVVVCAGWRDMVNAEDTLFAGALSLCMAATHAPANDATTISQFLYERNQGDLKGFLSPTSHFNRLLKLGLELDIDFCLTHNRYTAVPVLRDGYLVMG